MILDALDNPPELADNSSGISDAVSVRWSNAIS
jgi:hypothetical protein